MKRELFLQRVREAVGAGKSSVIAPPTVYPMAPAPRAELVNRFCREHEKALGKVHIARSIEEAGWIFDDLVEGCRSAIRSRHPSLDLFAVDELIRDARLTIESPASADVGITGADLAVAATGGVLLSSAHDRLPALLPPRHLIFLRADQIVEDLPDAYAWLASRYRVVNGDPRSFPSAWAFHTGPSRSADIEQTMAMGVHGPGRVDVILLDEPADE